MTIELTKLPPQPDVSDFTDHDDHVNLTAYTTALNTWKAVCARVMEGNERMAASISFWRS